MVTITHYPQPQSSPPCAASLSASCHLWLSPRSRSSPGRLSSAIYHHPLQIMVVSTTGISRRQDLKGSHYHDRKLASDLLIDRRGGPWLGFGCAFVPKVVRGKLEGYLYLSARPSSSSLRLPVAVSIDCPMFRYLRALNC